MNYYQKECTLEKFQNIFLKAVLNGVEGKVPCKKIEKSIITSCY